MNSGHSPRLPGCSVLPPMETRPAAHKASKPTGAKPPKGTANRFRELNSFVDCSMADLSRAELATWLVLWRDTKNGTVRTSMLDVARRIGTSRRAVVDAVAKLVGRGLLTVVFRGGLKRGTNVYRVHPLALPPPGDA